MKARSTPVRMPAITSEIMLRAYAAGIFPMAESADDPSLFWVEPEVRGVIPLDGFHLPSRLARTVRSDRFEIRIDREFDARHRSLRRSRSRIGPRPGSTGASATSSASCSRRAMSTLSSAGATDRLVGGLYGLSLGGAFFGESMFHRETDASKVALVHLVARLRRGGYRLLDAQFLTSHLAQFGTQEVPRAAYQGCCWTRRSQGQAQWWSWPKGETVSGAQALAELGASSQPCHRPLPAGSGAPRPPTRIGREEALATAPAAARQARPAAAGHRCARPAAVLRQRLGRRCQSGCWLTSRAGLRGRRGSSGTGASGSLGSTTSSVPPLQSVSQTS